jgi:hypothetical protein
MLLGIISVVERQPEPKPQSTGTINFCLSGNGMQYNSESRIWIQIRQKWNKISQKNKSGQRSGK